jgi:hypothetical protein
MGFMLDQQRIVLSQKALMLARDLGIRMAREDRVIRPRFFDLRHNKEYERFRDTHRAYWEQSDQFDQVWQPRIMAITEREAHRLSISDGTSVVDWDRSHNCIINPLKSVMWEAWERVYRLEYLHEQAVSIPSASPPLPAGWISPNRVSGTADGKPTRPRGLLTSLASLFHSF